MFRRVSQEDIERFGLVFCTNHGDPEDPETKRWEAHPFRECLEPGVFETRWTQWTNHAKQWVYVGPPKDCSENDPHLTAEYLVSQGIVGFYLDPTDINGLTF
jgi:hypothetical protein